MSLLFGPNLDQLLYCPGATLGPMVTMAGWFYPMSAGEGAGTVQAVGGTLIWHESTGTDARPRLGMFYGGSVQLIMFADFTGVDPDGTTSVIVTPLNQWTWVGMSWNFSTPTVAPVICTRTDDVFTQRGVTYSAPTGVPVGPNNGDGYNVRIGNNNRFNGCFHGYIAETYVWTRQLTIEEMRLVAFGGPEKQPVNLYFWYDPSVALTPVSNYFTTPDKSGNARTGVAINGVVFAAFEPPNARPGPTPEPVPPPYKLGWAASQVIDVYPGA